MATLLATSGCDSKKPFPVYRSPSVVCECSVTKDRDVLLDRSEAKYFHTKVLERGGQGCNFDLSEGFNSFESKDGVRLDGENLNLLIKAILDRAKPDAPLRELCCDADFVCYRGMLTRIACSPFPGSEGWIMAAVRIKSTIFLNEFKTEYKKNRELGMTPREKLMCYWGHKFEQFVTVDTPNSEPKTTEPVSELHEFDVLCRTTLGGMEPIRLLFAAETDCIDADGKYLELKTQAHSLSGNFWRNKALKWWVQSFLAGIEHIVVGYRNQIGVVGRVERIKVNELYRHAENWTPAVAFNFLLDTLTSMKQLMNNQKELEYVLFEFDPSKGCVTYKQLADDSEFAHFLPQQFEQRFANPAGGDAGGN